MFYSANGELKKDNFKLPDYCSKQKVIEGMADVPLHTHEVAMHSHNDTQNLDSIKEKQAELQAEINASKVPAGTIVMWSGSNLPVGWAICDGENGTPDLRGKFIVGLNTEDPSHNAVGKTGGAATVVLNENQLPKHKHMIEKAPLDDRNFTDGNNRQILGVVGDKGSNDADKNSGGANSGSNPSKRGRYTTEVGDNQPIENRPPFYTLAYIMKL
jgi:microcystin-dependent protein